MMNFVIVVPARGGSKRIDRKNIASLAGKPLLLWTIDAIAEAGFIDRTYVSTEDREIKDIAESASAAVINRPQELAGDRSSTESVLIHALDTLAAKGVSPDWVMTLPPTNPFRSPAMLQAFLEGAERTDGYDCLLSVTETTGDYWRMQNDGAMERLFPHAPRSQVGRKEEGFTLYEENSAVYMTRVNALRKGVAAGGVAPILGNKVKGIVMDPFEAFDINTPFDFQVAEAILASRRKTS